MSLDVYSGSVKLHGEEHENTLLEANNYADILTELELFEEARSLLRKVMPVAQRVLGESHEVMHHMWLIYAETLFKDDTTTLDDLRESVTVLEDAERISRRVFGGTHPNTGWSEVTLGEARAALREREASSGVATRTRAARARRSEEE